MTATLPELDAFDEPIIDLPFPLESFPPGIATWLEAAATQVRVPVSFVAFPFLAYTGAVLGNQAALQIGPGWTESPVLWTALVAPTGHGKTPALAAARAPFVTLHGVSSTFDALLDAALDELAAKRDLPEDQRPPSDDLPPDWADGEEGQDDGNLDVDFDWIEESSPLFTTTARLESLTRALSGSTGLCLLRDELAGLILSIDRGRDEDRQALLSLWSSQPVYPPDPKLDPILDPVLAITGGFQPRLFHRLRGATQDGLLERFLLVHPEPRPIPRHDPDLTAPDVESILARIQPLRPIDRTTVTLSPDAASAWRDWFHLNIAEIEAAGPTLEGFYRKFPSHVTRIALILHALWQPDELDSPLAESTMRHAIALGEYLRPHARRAAASLGQRGQTLSPVAALAQRALAILGIESRWVARTELQQRLGRPQTTRFNRAVASLVERQAIEVSKEKMEGSRKPVTLYRRLPRLAADANPAINGSNADQE